MTIEESDNPGGTFQFKNDTAISIQVRLKKRWPWVLKCA